jgi:short-subunit dehydrogenase
MKKTSLFLKKNIWIIGASEGIGKALAISLSDCGANLVISARSQDKLNDLNDSLKTNAVVASLDVSKRDDFTMTANFVLNLQKIDHIIYLPGIYEPTALRDLTDEIIDKSIDINLRSVFTLLQCTLPYLEKNPICQLAVVASAAGYSGLPHAQPYSATKAGVINLMESVKAEYPHVDIKLINPGFVKTRLTDKNKFYMPALISTEEAAEYILKGLLQKNFEIHFPKRFTSALKCLKLLPYKFYFWFLHKYFNRIEK